MGLVGHFNRVLQVAKKGRMTDQMATLTYSKDFETGEGTVTLTASFNVEPPASKDFPCLVDMGNIHIKNVKYLDLFPDGDNQTDTVKATFFNPYNVIWGDVELSPDPYPQANCVDHSKYHYKVSSTVQESV